MTVRPSRPTSAPNLTKGGAELVLRLLALPHRSSRVDKPYSSISAGRCNDCAPIPGHLCPRIPPMVAQSWC